MHGGTLRTTINLAYLQRNELERAAAITTRINEARSARGQPNLSLASAFEGLMYNRLQEAGTNMDRLFAQLRNPRDRAKCRTLMEEAGEAREREMGASALKLTEARRGVQITAYPGEEAGLTTQLDLETAINNVEKMNKRRTETGQNTLNTSHLLFGAVMKKFLENCLEKGERALELMPEGNGTARGVEIARLVRWGGILETGFESELPSAETRMS